MQAGIRIWVIEEREGLAARIRGECPDLSVTTVRRERIAGSSPVPNLAVVDATERLAACCSIREMRSRCPRGARPDCIAGIARPIPCRRISTILSCCLVNPANCGCGCRGFRWREAGRGRHADQDDSIREIRAKYRLDVVIGESAVLREAIRKVPRLGASEANVLITGETGTGKELFARAIHYASARQAHPFVPVNCGALPDTLFENEIFGHEKGAYTDASAAGAGLLAVADRGSLFLDEVDSLSFSSQAKLLRVLQDREYRPLGSQRAVKANVRIIAAANTPLAERVAAREFRADLYYRLNVLALRLPSLAERRGDIPILARHFLVRFAKECRRPAPQLSTDGVRRLMEHTWPGNIRELESAIQRALVLSDRPVLDGCSSICPAVGSWRRSLLAGSALPIEDAVYAFER